MFLHFKDRFCRRVGLAYKLVISHNDLRPFLTFTQPAQTGQTSWSNFDPQVKWMYLQERYVMYKKATGANCGAEPSEASRHEGWMKTPDLAVISHWSGGSNRGGG